MILGSGEYCYQVVKGWGQRADGRTLGIASGVAVDSQDRVYVVDREPNPAIVDLRSRWPFSLIMG